MRRAHSITVYKTDAGATVINGRLEPVNLDAETFFVFSLVENGRDTKTICDLAKTIPEKRTRKILESLLKEGIIVPETDFYPLDERIFSNTWKAYTPDYMMMDILPRIHVVQNDLYFQKISLLPAENGDVCMDWFKDVVTYASRTPVIQVCADLDSSHLLDIVKTAVKILEPDKPHFLFWMDKNVFSEKDMETLRKLTKTRITQCLSAKTLVSHVFGESTLRVGRTFVLGSQDNNVTIVFKGHENVDLTFFRKFLWVTVMVAPDKELLKNFPRFPPYVCLKNSYTLTLKEIDTALQSNNIFFWEDDMYRIQRAIQKCYLPLTDCGAGKRKIAITLDG